MTNEQPLHEPGLVVYNNQNSQPTVPLETTSSAPTAAAPLALPAPGAATIDEATRMSPPASQAAAGVTQPLKPMDFDKRGLPHRIQFLVRESGAILEKAARAPLVIGRRNSSLPVDIDLSDYNAHEMGISRTHFRIEPAPEGKLMVIDLRAANGTRLNGELLAPMLPYELHHGDEIRAGRIHLKVYFIY